MCIHIYPYDSLRTSLTSGARLSSLILYFLCFLLQISHFLKNRVIFVLILHPFYVKSSSFIQVFQPGLHLQAHRIVEKKRTWELTYELSKLSRGRNCILERNCIHCREKLLVLRFPSIRVVIFLFSKAISLLHRKEVQG